MSTENYGKYKFRYVHDRESSGKVKVYVEKGVNSRSEHIIPGGYDSPPYICFKEEAKPSSCKEAKSLAHVWADEYGH